MGMFDWVNIKVLCPKCGRKIEDFQSKDGDCMLECLEFWQVDNFYSYCIDCDAMIDYILKEDKRKKIEGMMKQVEDLIKNTRKSFTIDDYSIEFRETSALRKQVEERLDSDKLDNKEKEEKDTDNHEEDI